MFNLRSLFLFSLIAVLGLFIVQNLSTVLPLIVFGVRTPALPLGIWVLVAIALGFISSLFLQLPSSFSRPRPSPRENLRENFRENLREGDEEEFPEEPIARNQTYGGRPYQNEARSNPEVSSDISDWDLDFGDDWQDEPRPVNPPPRAAAPEPKQAQGSPPRSPANYGSVSPGRFETTKPEVARPEVGKTEVDKTEVGKTEVGKSGVGRTEAVYDANYRVINAPFSPPPKVAKAQEEDWGLEEDDDSVFDFPDLETKDSAPGGKKPGE